MTTHSIFIKFSSASVTFQAMSHVFLRSCAKSELRGCTPPYRWLIYVAVAVLADSASCICGNSSLWIASMNTCLLLPPLQNSPSKCQQSTGVFYKHHTMNNNAL